MNKTHRYRRAQPVYVHPTIDWKTVVLGAFAAGAVFAMGVLLGHAF